MNNREKRNIERTVTRWQTAMNLGGTAIRNFFSDEEVEQTAEVVTSWEYHEAAIIWYTKNCEDLTQEELDEAAVHELGHILVAPMSDHLPDEHHRLEEFTVTAITKAIMGVRNEMGNKR